MLKTQLILALYALIVQFLLAHNAAAERLHIAVASNFSHVMKQLVTQFEKKTGHTVTVSYASSGKLYSQIRHGAPFDVFFSADQDKPHRLIEEKLAIDDSLITYTIGALVLWSAHPQYINEELAALKNQRFSRLALANPKLAPYGMAAVEVLERLQLRVVTENNWVLGENIAQTYQFVRTRNAELGFVALAQIMQNGKISEGSAWIIPENWHTPIHQDAVLLIKAKDNPLAQSFLTFVQSEYALGLMRDYGYRH